MTCPKFNILQKKPEFSVANRTYEMINHTGENLNYHSENLVHLLTCLFINSICFGNSTPT